MPRAVICLSLRCAALIGSFRCYGFVAILSAQKVQAHRACRRPSELCWTCTEVMWQAARRSVFVNSTSSLENQACAMEDAIHGGGSQERNPKIEETAESSSSTRDGRVVAWPTMQPARFRPMLHKVVATLGAEASTSAHLRPTLAQSEVAMV